MNVTIHEKGHKGERDRQAALYRYRELCRFFRRKPVPDTTLAKMSNRAVYMLGEDLYNSRTVAEKRRYTDHLGLTGAKPSFRRSPLTLGSYVRSLLQVYQHRDLLTKVLIVLTAPFGYPGFLARSFASAKKAGVNPFNGEPLNNGDKEPA